MGSACEASKREAVAPEACVPEAVDPEGESPEAEDPEPDAPEAAGSGPAVGETTSSVAYHRQGAPVRASGGTDGEAKPSKDHELVFVTRLPARRWWPKKRLTPFARPEDAARKAPATFPAASEPTSPKGYCAPVKTTGLSKPTRA